MGRCRSSNGGTITEISKNGCEKYREELVPRRLQESNLENECGKVKDGNPNNVSEKRYEAAMKVVKRLCRGKKSKKEK